MNIIRLVGRPLSKESKKRIRKFILKNIYFDRFITTYDSWIVENFPDAMDILSQKHEIKSFNYRPLISVTVPIYNTPDKFLHECIRSVLTQSYENWELILVDDASPEPNAREIIKEYAGQDKRIKYKFLEQNHHIAGATNEAIKLSTGEFVGLFDHDDLLWPNALYEVVKALNQEKDIDFIYTDEDKIIEEKSRHAEPFFKPDWNSSLLRTCNYITHFSVFKRELLDKVGYEDGKYNGAQDWELIMRATRQAKKVHHVSKVVYSWRVHDNSTAKTMESKPYVIEAQRATIADDMIARGYNKNDFTVEQGSKFFAFWQTTLHSIGQPKVSVITLSKGQQKKIAHKTGYKNCEFISSRTFEEAIANADGEYIVLFEPNIHVKSRNWVEILLNNAVRQDTGLAGGLTTYKDADHIYSAGIALNQNKQLVHILSGGVSISNLKTLTRNVYAHAKRDTTALSGCVMVKKELLRDFKFNSSLSTTNQLALLGIHLAERGLSNIYDPNFINLVGEKYLPKSNRPGHKEPYSDKVLTIALDSMLYKSVLSRNYYHDDLVSYPDTEAL